MIRTALVCLALAGPVWADCGGYEQTFLTCQITDSTKVLSVCFDDEVASYRFGPKSGAPELEITQPIASLTYTPWPGAGSTIWEEVQFFNAGHSYMVVAAIERQIPDDPDADIGEGHFGGVLVHRGAKMVADLTCDPASIYINYMSGLSEAKNRLGYVWNQTDQAWVALPD